MIQHKIGLALREAMNGLVSENGTVLTPQLKSRIKKRTLDILKQHGTDLTKYKREIKLEFIRHDAPNLIIPQHLLGG